MILSKKTFTLYGYNLSEERKFTVDINGLPFTYENKDELVFPEPPPIPILETLRQEREVIEWEIQRNKNDLKEILAKIKEVSNEM